MHASLPLEVVCVCKGRLDHVPLEWWTTGLGYVYAEVPVVKLLPTFINLLPYLGVQLAVAELGSVLFCPYQWPK